MRPILLILWTAFQSFILRHNNNNNNNNNNNSSSSTSSSSSSNIFIIIICFVFVDPPTKGPHSEIVRAAEGTQVIFSCPVDGRPEPAITWYKGNDTTCKLQHQGRDWTFQAESNDAGWYSCFAANFLNPFKPVNASFQLIVGKFCWVLFLVFSGNNIAIELSL